MIEIKRPHCSKTQLRARKPKGSEHACKLCHRMLKREEGEAHKGATGR